MSKYGNNDFSFDVRLWNFFEALKNCLVVYELFEIVEMKPLKLLYGICIMPVKERQKGKAQERQIKKRMIFLV